VVTGPVETLVVSARDRREVGQDASQTAQRTIAFGELSSAILALGVTLYVPFLSVGVITIVWQLVSRRTEPRTELPA
jgi:hypothetical protein